MFGVSVLLAGCELNRSVGLPPTLDTNPEGSAPPPLPLVGESRCVDPALVRASFPTFRIGGCVHTAASGAQAAVFHWDNLTGSVQSASYGRDNRVVPGAAAQGQPETFPVGGSGRFIVQFDGSDVTWSVLGLSLSLSPSSDDCADQCLRPLGCIHCGSEDVCKEACGDGRCDESESCESCPGDCRCGAIEPFVDCVRALDDGTKVASFGFHNSGTSAGGVPYGPDNRFTTGDERRGQPVYFETGEFHHRFQVRYSGVDPAWTLMGRVVTVGPDTPACADECGRTCSFGTICIGGDCLTACGDGACTERCDTCSDCGCGFDEVCFEGGCANPPRCGIEAECGLRDDFGVHVDCGACPAGLACVANVCEPLCAVDGGAP